jgi:hypothetical protein
MTKLPPDTDLRVGVLPAVNASNPAASGLYSKADEPKVLSNSATENSAALSTAAIRSALGEKLLSLPSQAPAAHELPLVSLQSALTYPTIMNIKSDGLLRKDALLAVILVGDVNDACSGADEDCRKIVVKDLYNRLFKMQNGMPLSVSSLLTGETSQRPSTKTDELLRDANGYSFRLSAGSAAQALAMIGDNVAARLVTEMEFTMNAGDGSGAFRVDVDGRRLPPQSVSYNKDLSRVQLQRAGGPSSEVKIQYCRPY